MSFTVTVTQVGSLSNGMAFWLGVITGQAAVQSGATASATQITNSLAITPAASGSHVYGSILAIANAAYSALANTTIKQNVGGGGLEYISIRDTAVTAAGVAETIGVSQAANGISIDLCEITAAGTLAEDASTPGGTGFALGTTVTSASFNPPLGSLLILLVQSNGGAAVTTVTVTDTSGLSLTWTERVKQNGAGNGYSGIWTAAMPLPPAAAAAAVPAGGGTSMLKRSLLWADL